MKKFLATILVLVLIIGGVGAYVFLSSEKFILYGYTESWKYLGSKLEQAFINSSKQDYYDYTVTRFEDSTDTTTIYQIKIKEESTGFIAYASKNEKIGNADPTTQEYFKGESATTAVKLKDGTEDNISVNTIMGFIYYVDTTLNAALVDMMFNYTEPQATFVAFLGNMFDSSNVVFNFSPFYLGVNYALVSTDVKNEYKIDKSFNIRESYKTSLIEGDKTYIKMINNNVGKQISIPTYTAV